MYYAEIVKSLGQKQKKPYTPQFRVRKEKRGWRVFDAETAIAFFYPTFLDIWSFSPFEPPILFNVQEPGRVVDLYTVHNTVVNLAAHGWPKQWFGEGRSPDDMLTWKWLKKQGPEVEAQVTLSAPEGEGARWVIRIFYDPAWARYRYTVDIEAWKHSPEGFEPFNMMLAGALCCRCEDRRWTHSVWESAEGTLYRLVHSNALFTATDYEHSAWRTSNLPFRGAWVAYAAHDTFNPCLLIRDNNVPLRRATCSQLFDEHIIWNDAGLEQIEADGLFHFRMTCEFVNLSGVLARKLLEKAQDPVQPRQWRQDLWALPFRMGEVNSFEEPVDVWAAEDCPVLVLSKQAGAGIAWTDEAARSGRYSLRLDSAGRTSRRELFPIGAVCNVKSHTPYRLSGWIKSRGVERYARLELASYEYHYDNVMDAQVSPAVRGTRDWTYVEVTLDSGEEAYLMPKLVLYGPGHAWFDDVLLEEVL